MAIRAALDVQKVCALRRGLKPSAHAPPRANGAHRGGTMDLVEMPRQGGLSSERFRLDAVSEITRCDIEER